MLFGRSNLRVLSKWKKKRYCGNNHPKINADPNIRDPYAELCAYSMPELLQYIPREDRVSDLAFVETICKDCEPYQRCLKEEAPGDGCPKQKKKYTNFKNDLI
jgi:hypothetical protein